MARRWVINASPIISLAKIGRINLLAKLCDDAVIPQGVADEIQLGGYDDSAVSWLREKGQTWIRPIATIEPNIANWDLGLGESQVLSWATTHPGYEAILDDRAARKAAKILKVPVRGTLAVILLAKKSGYIPLVKPELDNLVQVGLRLSPSVLAQALALASE